MAIAKPVYLEQFLVSEIGILFDIARQDPDNAFLLASNLESITELNILEENTIDKVFRGPLNKELMDYSDKYDAEIKKYKEDLKARQKEECAKAMEERKSKDPSVLWNNRLKETAAAFQSAGVLEHLNSLKEEIKTYNFGI